MKPEQIPDTVSRGNVNVAERLIILNRTEPHAVLATESAGQPYTSLIAYALTPDAKRLLFITPRRTQKFKNILRNRRVSLLIDNRRNTDEDYMSAESVTIMGTAQPVKRGTTRMELATIFARKHPRLKSIISSPETALILVQITVCIHVTRFQSVTIWEVR